MTKGDEAQLRNVRNLDAWASAQKGRSWECVCAHYGRWTVVGWQSGEEQFCAIASSPENARAEAQQYLRERSEP